MKLAISGKGGVGKSTIAAALALLLARRGVKVLALDADPAATLARALGVPEEKQKKIIPIARQAALIEERTGAKVRSYGQIFKLNPEVSDIADKHALLHEGVSLLVLGGVQMAGGGCACPENVLLRALVSDLVLYKDEALVMDMEAGVEHLGRATAQGVDTMLVVSEPSQSAVTCAKRIKAMAEEIGIKRVCYVGNKISTAEDTEFLQNALGAEGIVAYIPYAEEIRTSDRAEKSVLAALGPELIKVFEGILDWQDK